MCCNVACVYHSPKDSAHHLQATGVLQCTATAQKTVPTTFRQQICYLFCHFSILLQYAIPSGIIPLDKYEALLMKIQVL
jgi:hypothetical protein